MAEPYRGILGPVLGQVEAIKSARSNRAMDELQSRYLGERIQTEQLGREQATQAAARQADVEIFANGLSAIHGSDQPSRIAPRIVGSPQWQSAAERLGMPAKEFLNTQDLDDNAWRTNTADLLRQIGVQIQGPEAFTLSPGQIRMQGTQQVAAAPFEPPKPGTEALEEIVGPDGNPIFVPRSRAIGQQPWKATDKGPGFEQASKLRAEFNTQSTEFRGATQGYQNVLSASANPSAAGDIALIFSFMRTLDPNSTVREGEFATAESAGSVPSRIWGQYNRVLKGERLAPEQRQDFISQATELYRGQIANHKRLRTKYEGLATSAGVNPMDVLGESLAIDIQQQRATPPPAQGELPRIQTDDDFNRLPPGPFIAPDGTTRMKN